jgi:hypothetical protein
VPILFAFALDLDFALDFAFDFDFYFALGWRSASALR